MCECDATLYHPAAQRVKEKGLVELQLAHPLLLFFVQQVKCPECRAEHRIPYNGIQGFPTNYTLQKFLELHSEITGKKDIARNVK